MQDFMIAILICSVTMSVLALIYMALTPLLEKRYSAKGRYYAWLIIIFGLIIPFRPHFGNAVVKIDIPSETVTPAIQIGNGLPIDVPIPVENTALPSVSSNISWWQIAATVWLAGMIIFLAYHVIKHYRFLKLIARWSENIKDEQTLTLFQNLKTEMGISKHMGLKLCTSIGSPMMIGFVNPRILLPKLDFEQDELHFILKHELVHHKRKDLWYKCLVLIATAIHWFNPIVYLTARAIDVQCEFSCDYEVVQSTDADTRQHYSETIIGVVKYQSKLRTALSTNFYGGKRGMKKRIFYIMDSGKKKAGIAIICCMIILTMGTGMAFAASASTNANIFAVYEQYGLTYNKETNRLYYNGELVRYFEDNKNTDGTFNGTTFPNVDGNVDVHTVRDSAGKLTGITQYIKEGFDVRTENIQTINGNVTQISEINKKVYINGLGENSFMNDGDVLYNLKADNELSFELNDITTAVMKNGVMEKGSNLKLDIELTDSDGNTESKCTVSLDKPTAIVTAKKAGQYHLVVTNVQSFSVNFNLTVVKN